MYYMLGTSNILSRTEVTRVLFLFAALYGVLFPRQKEAAFANYRMWESLGFVIAFAYSTFLCLDIKLYILLGVLILSMVTYLWVEYQERKNPTLPVEEGIYDTDYSTTGNHILNQTSL